MTEEKALKIANEIGGEVVCFDNGEYGVEDLQYFSNGRQIADAENLKLVLTFRKRYDDNQSVHLFKVLGDKPYSLLKEHDFGKDKYSKLTADDYGFVLNQMKNYIAECKDYNGVKHFINRYADVCTELDYARHAKDNRFILVDRDTLECRIYFDDDVDFEDDNFYYYLTLI